MFNLSKIIIRCARNYALSLCAVTLVCAASPLPVIEKSPHDSLSYRAITLSNGLQAVLIHDPDADKAGAAVNVGIGSFHEPQDLLGGAHFLEHMLFLGNQKYPKPDEYFEYIKKHGGQANAFTASQETVYYFDILPDFIEPALDRLSQFFLTPVFDAKYVEREKHAVDSEFKSQLQNDGWRALSVLQHLANPKHPFHAFSFGNLQTLSSADESTLYQRVREFYDTHYSANHMHVVVVSSKSLNDMEQMVKDKFSQVVSQEVNLPDLSQVPLFDTTNWPIQVDIKPVKDMHLLKLNFLLPSEIKSYLTKPTSYLVSLLAARGEGSLYALLKHKNWLEDYSVYYDDITLNNDMLEANFSLTEAGIKHQDDIIAYFLQYVELIRQEGVSKWRFDEMQKMANLSFQYRDKLSAFWLTAHVSMYAKRYPTEHLLTGEALLHQYSEKDIQAILKLIRPENMMIIWRDLNVITDKETPHFKVPYAVRDINTDRLTKWQSSSPEVRLHLPAKNHYIPNQVKPIHQADQSFNERPVLDSEAKDLPIWCLPDGKFAKPKVDVRYRLTMKKMLSDSKASALLDLYVSLLSDTIPEKFYPAIFAGNSLQVSQDHDGLVVHLQGYDKDVLLQLMQDLHHLMLHHQFSYERFDALKAELKRHYDNAELNKPYMHIFAQMDALLLERRWLPSEKRLMLQQISYQDMQGFIKTLTDIDEVRALLFGNLHCDFALKAQSTFKQLFPHAKINASSKDLPVVKLQENHSTVSTLNSRHDNHALGVFYQINDTSDVAYVHTMLLKQLFDKRFFNELRTEKQLGYIVGLSQKSLYHTTGITYFVQSPNYQPKPIQNEIKAFHKRALNYLISLKSKELLPYQQTIRDLLLKEPANRKEWFGRFWSEISEGSFDFTRRELLAKAVMVVTPESLLAFYKKTHGKGSALLLIQTPHGELVETDSKIDDVDDFKASRARFKVSA